MRNILEFFSFGTFAFLLSHILTPYIRNLANKFCLIDHPNFRKVHSVPIPLVGGIVIGVTFFFVGIMAQEFFKRDILIIMSGAYVMLMVGIIDDKTDLKALYKLYIQCCLGFFVALYGIRITSFYGLFGIYSIPLFWQYFVTILLIVSSINAFNFMDGINGLASGIALLGSAFLAILSLVHQDYLLAKLSVILVGTLICFLRYNFSKTHKIFLGDSGSLFLGFILITFGIYYIENCSDNQHKSGILYLLLVFLLPIFDFARVFSGRLARRLSPFAADKTHLHHHLMQLGFSHKAISLLVALINILILVLGFLITQYGSLEMLILCVVLVFFFYKLLATLKNFYMWRQKIKEMEKRS